MKRGQISLEYIMILSFVFAIMIPAIVLAYQAFSAHQDTVHTKQAEQAANLILREAAAVYYLGPPSLSRIEVFIPENVFGIVINGNELIFRVRTKRGIEDVGVPATINITGSLPVTPGLHRVTVAAKGGYVEVSQ